ncbi:hypothetical protein [Halarcobacter sp.]|uniref:hypothetical protein n=1 Tax=Halarcobacter sp. TaxID=2321133 RepID=UPI003A8EB94E
MKERQIIALEHLSIHKFLTSSQFVQLNLYKNRGEVTNALKELLESKKPLIGKKNFKPDPTYGKVESIYYLTQYGKNYLVKNFNYLPENIKFIKKEVNLFQREYHHRRSTVDFNIGLYKWIQRVDGEIIFSHYYFDKKGNNHSKDKSKHLCALNKLELKDGKSFIPDMITMFNIKGKEYLYLFEQNNDYSTTRLINELLPYLYAMSDGLFENIFGFKRSPRIAVVCKNENVKYNLLKRLRTDERFKHFYNLFIFKSNDELLNNFEQNWTLINGQKVSFIQPEKAN